MGTASWARTAAAQAATAVPAFDRVVDDADPPAGDPAGHRTRVISGDSAGHRGLVIAGGLAWCAMVSPVDIHLSRLAAGIS
jgi:hypothetical protein